MLNVMCHQCGEEFLGKTKRKKFCSKLCISRHNNPPVGKKGEYRKCALCGKEKYFMPNALNRKESFCSKEHHLIHMKQNAFHLDCVICGATFYTQPAQIKYRNRKTCSLLCRAKRQSLLAEERNKNNPPSVGVLNRRIRYSAKMDDWRKAIFDRDNYTCQICFKKGGTLNADHIKPFSLFPDLRFELSNGRTLCVKCHRETDTWGRKAIYRNL